MMKQFTISANTILDPRGERFVVKGSIFQNYLYWDTGTGRADQTIRNTFGSYTFPAGVSPPTFQDPWIWKSEQHVMAQLDAMKREGFNFFRIGTEPACKKTKPYTYTFSDGTTKLFPSNVEMMDFLAEQAARREMYMLITVSADLATQAQIDDWIEFLANRYKIGGEKENAYVGICPYNEMLCSGPVIPHCLNPGVWRTTSEYYVNLIRGTGYTGLIYLCLPNFYSMAMAKPQILASSILTNDGRIVYTPHSYRLLNQTWAGREATERAEYLDLCEEFPIVIGETGFQHDPNGHRYDGEIDHNRPSDNPTQFTQAVAYETARLPVLVDAIENGGLNGVVFHTYQDRIFIGSGFTHEHNTMLRHDSVWTTWGNLVRELFLKPLSGIVSAPPPAPEPWETIFTQSLPYTSGAVGGYLYTNIIPANTATKNYSKIRITTAAGSYTGCAIAEQASSGDAWDGATALTRFKHSGADAYSGTNKVSDTLTFAWDKTKAYIIRHAPASGGVPYGGTASPIYYYKPSAAAELLTANINNTGGGSVAGGSIITKIEGLV